MIVLLSSFVYEMIRLDVAFILRSTEYSTTMLFNPMNRVHTHPHFVFGSPSWQSLHVSICLHFSYKVDVFVTHSDWLQLSLTAFVKNCHRVTMKIKLMLPRVKIQGDGSYSLVCEDVYCEVIGDLFIYIWLKSEINT